MLLIDTSKSAMFESEASQASLSFNVPEDMRALVLEGVGFEHLKMSRVQTPQSSANQILARVDAAGICTSLIKLVEQG